MEKYQGLDSDELNRALIEECEKGNLTDVKYLLHLPQIKSKKNNWNCFLQACLNGHLIIAQHVLKTTNIENFNFQKLVNLSFINACRYGHMDVIRYLSTSPELKNNAKINTNSDLAFLLACSNKNLELIKYLSASKELKVHANIFKGDVFESVCARGYFDAVEYFTSSPELPKKINVNDFYLGFTQAGEFGHLDIVKYLVNSPKLTHHADPNILNIYSNNIFVRVCTNGHLDIVKFFLDDKNLKEPINKKNLNDGF